MEEALIPNHPAIHALLNPYHWHTLIRKYVMVVATGTNQEPTKNELTSYLEDILGGIVLTLSKSNVYCNDCKWIGRRGGRSLK